MSITVPNLLSAPGWTTAPGEGDAISITTVTVASQISDLRRDRLWSILTFLKAQDVESVADRLFFIRQSQFWRTALEGSFLLHR